MNCCRGTGVEMTCTARIAAYVAVFPTPRRRWKVNAIIEIESMP